MRRMRGVGLKGASYISECQTKNKVLSADHPPQCLQGCATSWFVNRLKLSKPCFPYLIFFFLEVNHFKLSMLLLKYTKIQNMKGLFQERGSTIILKLPSSFELITDETA